MKFKTSARQRRLHKKWIKNNPEKVRANRNKWRKEHPVETAEQKRRCYRNNPQKYKEMNRTWRRRNPKKMFGMRLRYLYGISPEKLEQMKVAQEFKCLICKKQKPLCIDHDHKTKKVRGLLCRSCNRALGWLEDDVKMLESAIQYLKTNRDSIYQIPDELDLV